MHAGIVGVGEKWLAELGPNVVENGSCSTGVWGGGGWGRRVDSEDGVLTLRMERL